MTKLNVLYKVAYGRKKQMDEKAVENLLNDFKKRGFLSSEGLNVLMMKKFDRLSMTMFTPAGKNYLKKLRKR